MILTNINTPSNIKISTVLKLLWLPFINSDINFGTWCQNMEMLSNYWPSVQGIHQSLMDFLHKGQVVPSFGIFFAVYSLKKQFNNQSLLIWDSVTFMWCHLNVYILYGVILYCVNEYHGPCGHKDYFLHIMTLVLWLELLRQFHHQNTVYWFNITF